MAARALLHIQSPRQRWRRHAAVAGEAQREQRAARRPHCPHPTMATPTALAAVFQAAHPGTGTCRQQAANGPAPTRSYNRGTHRCGRIVKGGAGVQPELQQVRKGHRAAQAAAAHVLQHARIGGKHVVRRVGCSRCGRWNMHVAGDVQSAGDSGRRPAPAQDSGPCRSNAGSCSEPHRRACS